MKRKIMIVILAAFALITMSDLFDPTCCMAGKLDDAIASTPKGAGPGKIDPGSEPGFMGIPGAPKINWSLALAWGVLCGWIFSTVGAFGGIMAGVGHITVFGLADYGRMFKNSSPVLNNMLTDSIRVSNQYLAALAALIASTTYYRMGRVVLPLGLCLAAGSLIGAYSVPVLTAGKINLSMYVGYFGICVLVVGGILFYETTAAGQASRMKAKDAAKAFEDDQRLKKSQSATNSVSSDSRGVRIKSLGVRRIVFTFYGVEFSFNPLWPVIGGLVISAISSFIGVGGGFLYVPFLTSVAGLPMFIVAGTSAVAVLVSMVTSIFTFMFVKQVPVDFTLIGIQLVGIFCGTFLGTYTSKYMPEIWIKRFFVLLSIYVGVGYSTKGFLGQSFLPGI